MGDDPLFEEDQSPKQQYTPVPVPSGPWRPRFGIAGMMLATFLFSMLCLMGHYMLNVEPANQRTNSQNSTTATAAAGNPNSTSPANTSTAADNPKRFSFIFVTLAAPILVLTLLSVGKELMRLWEKESRKQRRRQEESSN